MLEECNTDIRRKCCHFNWEKCVIFKYLFENECFDKPFQVHWTKKIPRKCSFSWLSKRVTPNFEPEIDRWSIKTKICFIVYTRCFEYHHPNICICVESIGASSISRRKGDGCTELETTEGEGVDLLNELWWDDHRLTTRRRRRTCLDYCLDDCLINCVQHGLCFLINSVEPWDQQVHSQVG